MHARTVRVCCLSYIWLHKNANKLHVNSINFKHYNIVCMSTRSLLCLSYSHFSYVCASLCSSSFDNHFVQICAIGLGLAISSGFRHFDTVHVRKFPQPATSRRCRRSVAHTTRPHHRYVRPENLVLYMYFESEGDQNVNLPISHQLVKRYNIGCKWKQFRII